MMKFIPVVLLLLLADSLTAQQNVLHYDETTGFNHGTRTVSLAMFTSIGSNNGFTVTQDSDGSSFTQAILENFDLVIFSNTSGNNGLDANQRAALEWFVDTKGGSLMGIHAASDTYRHSSANGGGTGAWDWYAETMGGSVQATPYHTSANHVDTINLINAHPSVNGISFPWNKEEEYYYWENGYLNADINEVLRVEETGGDSWDAARPVAWTRAADSGAKIFYTSLGHKTGNYTGSFPVFEQLMETATSWLLTSEPLGVELRDFTATPNYESKQIDLSWTTSSETNSNYFDLEHSIEGTTWHAFDRVQALGTRVEVGRYTASHAEPIQGINRYRLRQVDLDGTFQYSPEIELDFKTSPGLRSFPNPANDQITFSFGRIVDQASISIYDLSGRLVLEENGIESSSKWLLDLRALPGGIYFAQLRSNSGLNLETLKFVRSE